MAILVWKLKPYLVTRSIKACDVEAEARRLGYNFGKNTVYRVLSGDGPANLNRNTLVALIASLRSLTGDDVAVGDLIEYVEAHPNPLSQAEKPHPADDV